MYVHVYKHAGRMSYYGVAREAPTRVLFHHEKAFRKAPNESFVKSAIDSAFLLVDEKIWEKGKKASACIEWQRDSIASRSEIETHPVKYLSSLSLFFSFFCINRLNFHTRKVDAVESSWYSMKIYSIVLLVLFERRESSSTLKPPMKSAIDLG